MISYCAQHDLHRLLLYLLHIRQYSYNHWIISIMMIPPYQLCFALLGFPHGRFYPHISGLFHWYRSNLVIAPVSVKHPKRIWVDRSRGTTKDCWYKHHDDVIKWKHFQRNWPFVRGIHRSPVNYPHKGQWRGALMFSVICARINGWVNNREAGDLRRHRTHYDVTVMMANQSCVQILWDLHCDRPFFKLFCYFIQRCDTY